MHCLLASYGSPAYYKHKVKSDYRKFLYLTENDLYVTYTVPLKDHNTSVAYL